MSLYSLEPELQQPVPRRARRKSSGCGIGCIQIFLLPHTLVGIGVLIWAIHGALVLMLGISVPGTVVEKKSSRGSKGGMTYHLTYNYAVDGRDHQVKSQVSRDDYDLVNNGSPVSVKVWSATPSMGSIVIVPGGSSRGMVGFRWIFALFWNAILSVFYLAMYGTRILHKSLVKNGVAVSGIITDKSIQRGKSTTHVLHYQFEPSLSHGLVNHSVASQALMTMRTAKMTVSHNNWQEVNIGDVVTILYSPRNPSFSAIYRYAEYAAE